MRKFLKPLVLCGLLLLLIAPLIAIFMLSKAEVKQYEPQSVPPLVEKAYGEICSAKRMDISETITVSGTFVSTKKFFMDLPKLKNPNAARMLVQPGDEIAEEQLIGYSEDLKQEIRATASGIVLSINLGSTSYITLESTNNVALNCGVDNATLAVLKRKGLKLTTQEGQDIKMLSISKIQDENGKTSVLLFVPNGVYGQKINNLRLRTGRVFNQVLVVSPLCLFHQNGDEKTWYVRTVDANGNYLEDIKVRVGYSNEDYIAVSGITEGTLCDSGYKKIIGEK